MIFFYKKNTFIFFGVLVVILIFFVKFGAQNHLLAAVMQSVNYKIEYDSPLTSSGGPGVSVNYIFDETAGEVSTGDINSSSYKIKSGYQGIQGGYISISSPADAAMSPNIPGITGGTTDANIIWNVVADNPSGFIMKIHASTAPALKLDASYYFSDYTPTSAGVPDYNWGVASGDAEFGFSVEPATAADATQSFKDDGSSACNTGSYQTTDKCWLNLNGASDISAINRTGRTGVTGEDEKIKFKAQSSAKFLKSGNYSASVTVTVAAN
jgi:hypothetical protein